MKTKLIKGKVDILLISTTSKVLLDNPNVVLKMISNMKPELKNELDNWQFLSTLKDLTEDQAEELVPHCINACERETGYKNYLNDRMVNLFRKPTDSFQSLLEANGVTEANPFGKTCPIIDPDASSPYYGCQVDNLKDWQQAEQNVFNPENTLIFKKS